MMTEKYESTAIRGCSILKRNSPIGFCPATVGTSKRRAAGIHHRHARGATRIAILLIWLLLVAASRADNTALVAAYSFDEGTGTTATDISGNGNDGTISGASWTSAGKYGTALSFGGTGSYVTIPDSPSLHLTTAMTLEAWVNPSVVNSAWRDVIYKGDDNYYLEATSRRGAAPGGGGTFGGTDDAGAYASTPLAPNTWTHLAVTYDGATVNLYVNGVLVSSGAETGDLLTSGNPLQIGGDSIYGQYFQGMIDEVRVYNVALTVDQIQSDMTTPIGLVVDTTAPSWPSGLLVLANPALQVMLYWNPSTDLGGSGLAGYQVYRNDVLIGSTTATEYSDLNLAAGAQYCYSVVAYDNAGNNSLSSPPACVTTPGLPSSPNPPSNLIATAIDDSTVNLVWTSNSNNELGFQIEQAPTADGPWNLVGTVGAGVTTFADTGLVSATTYYYRVSAFN